MGKLTNNQEVGRNDVLKQRFSSLQYQLKSVVELADVQHLLKIGPGRGYFRAMAQLLGYEIKTLDRNADNHPDYDCEITELDPPMSFDAVLAFEVLEHMPYQDSIKFFSEMVRLTSRYVIVSIPTRQLRLRRIAKLRSPRLPDLLPVDREDHWKPHHWEIGRKSYPATRIVSDYCDQGVKLVRQFSNPRHKYHTFFVFETGQPER